MSRIDSRFIHRMELLDVVLGKIVSTPSLAEVLTDNEIKPWLDEMLAASKPYGAGFWRYKLAVALVDGDEGEQWRVAKALIAELSDADISESVRTAPQVIDLWLSTGPADDSRATQLLVSSVSALIASRRMPSLPWSLRLMTEVVLRTPRLVNEQVISLIEIGLEHMHPELSYQGRKKGSGIPDDLVPSIRFHCIRLAVAMHRRLPGPASEVVARWVSEISTDPLPEIRLIEEQFEGQTPVVETGGSPASRIE